MVPGEFKELFFFFFQVTPKILRRWCFRWWIFFLFFFFEPQTGYGGSEHAGHLTYSILMICFCIRFLFQGLCTILFFNPWCLSARQILFVPNCTDYSRLLTLSWALIRSLLKIKSYHESRRAFVGGKKKNFARMPWSLGYTEMFLIKPPSGPHVLLTLFCCVPTTYNNITKSEV